MKALGILLLSALAGACTITGAERAATKDLHWFGFRSHTDLRADGRWQFPPGTRIRVEETAQAADPAWLPAARAGVHSVFEPPGEGADMLLRVSWPADRLEGAGRRGGLLPRASDALDLELKLVSLDDDRVIQTVSMRVDPAWFSAARRRPEQIRTSFARFAAGIATSR